MLLLIRNKQTSQGYWIKPYVFMLCWTSDGKSTSEKQQTGLKQLAHGAHNPISLSLPLAGASLSRRSRTTIQETAEASAKFGMGSASCCATFRERNKLCGPSCLFTTRPWTFPGGSRDRQPSSPLHWLPLKALLVWLFYFVWKSIWAKYKTGRWDAAFCFTGKVISGTIS